jgi:hypothetical protein
VLSSFHYKTYKKENTSHFTSWTKGTKGIHGLLGLKYHPEDKANAIADCLENQFTPHDLCDENHEQRVEAMVHDLLEAADSDLPERIRPCDLQMY